MLTRPGIATTLLLAALLSAGPAQAFVLVTVREVGADVVASASGALNVSGLTYGGASGYTYGIDPDTSTFLINPGPSSAIYTGSFTLPGVLGPGTTNNLPSSGSGDQFGIAIYHSALTLFTPNNSGG